MKACVIELTIILYEQIVFKNIQTVSHNPLNIIILISVNKWLKYIAHRVTSKIGSESSFNWMARSLFNQVFSEQLVLSYSHKLTQINRRIQI